MLDNRVAQDEVEGRVLIRQWLAEVCDANPARDLRMKPARLGYVFFYRVHPIDIVPLSPVHEDVPRACTAAGIQSP